MPNKKISELTELLTPESTDIIPIVDISEGDLTERNKYSTVQNILAAVPTDGEPYVEISYTGTFPVPGADSIAIGENITTLANTIAIGINIPTVSSNNGQMIGIGKNIDFGGDGGNGNIVIGFNTSAGAGDDQVSIGNNADSGEGGSSVAIGSLAFSNGLAAVAISRGAQATNVGAIAIGDSAIASAATSHAIGVGAVASGLDSIAIGNLAQATVTDALALGDGAICSGIDSISIGEATNVSATLSIGIGDGVTVSAANAIAIGDKAQATAQGGASYGAQAIASGFDAISIGSFSTASDQNAIAIGTSANVAGASVAIGDNANTGSTNFAVAIGRNTNAGFISTVAIGNGATLTTGSTDSIAIGSGTTASTISTIVGRGSDGTYGSEVVIVGHDNTGGSPTWSFATSCIVGHDNIIGASDQATAGIAIGNDNTVEKGDSSLIFGHSNNVDTAINATSNVGSICIGLNNDIVNNTMGVDQQRGIILGNDCYIEECESGLAIGDIASVLADRSISIGYNTTVNNTSANAVCIGSNAIVNNNGSFGNIGGAIAIGLNAQSFDGHNIAIGNNAEIRNTAADPQNVVLLGRNSYSDGSNSTVVIGRDASVQRGAAEFSGENAIVIGSQATADANSTKGVSNSVVIGHSADIEGATEAIAIGRDADISGDSTNSADASIAIGHSADIFKAQYGIAIGSSAEVKLASISGIAIGRSADVGSASSRSVAIGESAFVSDTTEDAVQIGTGTNSTGSTFQFLTNRLANAEGLYTSFTAPTNYTPADDDNITSHLTAIDTAIGTALASGNTAATTSYNNATSALTATNVQAAIDELDGAIDALELIDHQPLTIAVDGVSDDVLSVDGSQVITANLVTTSTDGVMSSTDKTKLDGIETGATADQNAAEVSYSNGTSGLAATDVQGAIDEVVANGVLAETQNTGVAPTSTPADGTIIVDEQGTGTLYVRVAGVWRSVALA